MIELLDLSTANFDKVALLRAGYAAPIPARAGDGQHSAGQNTFEDIDNILHRGLAIFEALGEGIGDKREARRKLTKLERSVVQDTTRAENWLMHFNAVFDISGIPESEFKQFMLPACNATVHTNLKDSAVDDLIDILHAEEKSLGRECTRAEICELYIERDKFLWDKLAAKDIYSGHLMPDTRSAITDEHQAKHGRHAKSHTSATAHCRPRGSVIPSGQNSSAPQRKQH